MSSTTPSTQRLLGTVEQARGDQAVDIGRGDRAVADPPARSSPPRPAAPATACRGSRCGPTESSDPAALRRSSERRPPRPRRRSVPRSPLARRRDRRRQRVHRATASSTIDVNRASSSRPRSRPLTCAAGPNAQLPRQKTCSTVNEPSGLVSPSDMPQASCRWLTSRSAPSAWHASPRQMRTTVRPAGCGTEVVVERDHPMHIGTGQVQLVSQHRNRFRRHTSQGLLDRMQDGKQGAALPSMTRGDISDKGHAHSARSFLRAGEPLRERGNRPRR